MCHIFFIHSSVDGHLGCFHVLAIGKVLIKKEICMKTMYSFSVAAITNKHRRHGLKLYTSFISQFWRSEVQSSVGLTGLQSRCQQGELPSGGSREEPVPLRIQELA